MAQGFVQAMREKLSIVLRYTKTEQKPFIYSDVDVRFNTLLDPVPSLTKIIDDGGYDMACQNDYGGVCMGFMVIIPTRKNADFLQAVLDHMDSNPSICDQRAFYEMRVSRTYSDTAKPIIKLLDVTDGFGNFCQIQSNVLWQPENNALEKNRDIVQRQFMWHANHTIGVENKMKMLDRFKEICQNA